MSTRVDPAELGNVAAQLLFLRRRGGQPGNQNAVTHGRFSTPTRAARKAAREESDRQHAEWMKTIPKTDYGAICEAIKAHDLRVCVWEYPYVSVHSPLFVDLASRNYLLTKVDGDPYVFGWDTTAGKTPYGNAAAPLPESCSA